MARVGLVCERAHCCSAGRGQLQWPSGCRGRELRQPAGQSGSEQAGNPLAWLPVGRLEGCALAKTGKRGAAPTAAQLPR